MMDQNAMALPCVRREGHAGPHIDRDQDTWSNDMASCTETNNEGQQCYLIRDHDQEHRFTSVVIACNTLLDDGVCAGVRGHRGDCTANADDIPSMPETDQCGAHRREGSAKWPCTRPSGHARYHQDSDGHRWSFPTLLEEMCGAITRVDDSEHSRACRLPTDHAGEHLDQCPSTIGKPGEGEHEHYLIVQCDGPPGHEGVHHNEEHKHAWNPDGYPPAEPVTESYDARLTRLEEQPTLTELATSLGRIMERLNVVEENADRAVKIAENLRVRVPAYSTGGDPGLAMAALTSQLRKLTEVLDNVTRLEAPAPVEVAPDPVPETCPARLTYGGPGSGYRCIRHRDHEGLHMDSDNDMWGITGL